MTVDVYWNSTRRVFSIRRNGRVIDHATDVALLDATFHSTGVRGERVQYRPDEGGETVTLDGPIRTATNVHLFVNDRHRPEVRAWTT